MPERKIAPPCQVLGGNRQIVENFVSSSVLESSEKSAVEIAAQPIAGNKEKTGCRFIESPKLTEG